jgi:hypothetical protein
VTILPVSAQTVATLLEQRIATGGWRNRYRRRQGNRRRIGCRHRLRYRRRLGRLLDGNRNRQLDIGERRRLRRARRRRCGLPRTAALSLFPVSFALLHGAFAGGL